MNIREQIAYLIRESHNPTEYTPWLNGRLLTSDEVVDAILLLPGIRVESEDQSLPDNPLGTGWVSVANYAQAQQDMLAEGWVKCEKKEVE